MPTIFQHLGFKAHFESYLSATSPPKPKDRRLLKAFPLSNELTKVKDGSMYFYRDSIGSARLLAALTS